MVTILIITSKIYVFTYCISSPHRFLDGRVVGVQRELGGGGGGGRVRRHLRGVKEYEEGVGFRRLPFCGLIVM